MKREKRKRKLSDCRGTPGSRAPDPVAGHRRRHCRVTCHAMAIVQCPVSLSQSPLHWPLCTCFFRGPDNGCVEKAQRADGGGFPGLHCTVRPAFDCCKLDEVVAHFVCSPIGWSFCPQPLDWVKDGVAGFKTASTSKNYLNGRKFIRTT